MLQGSSRYESVWFMVLFSFVNTDAQVTVSTVPVTVTTVPVAVTLPAAVTSVPVGVQPAAPNGPGCQAAMTTCLKQCQAHSAGRSGPVQCNAFNTIYKPCFDNVYPSCTPQEGALQLRVYQNVSNEVHRIYPPCVTLPAGVGTPVQGVQGSGSSGSSASLNSGSFKGNSSLASGSLQSKPSGIDGMWWLIAGLLCLLCCCCLIPALVYCCQGAGSRKRGSPKAYNGYEMGQADGLGYNEGYGQGYGGQGYAPGYGQGQFDMMNYYPPAPAYFSNVANGQDYQMPAPAYYYDQYGGPGYGYPDTAAMPTQVWGR